MARAAIVVAAFAASALTMAAVGLAFDAASSRPWLRDPPQARSEFARCSAFVERAARRDCLHAVVAQARA